MYHSTKYHSLAGPHTLCKCKEGRQLSPAAGTEGARGGMQAERRLRRHRDKHHAQKPKASSHHAVDLKAGSFRTTPVLRYVEASRADAVLVESGRQAGAAGWRTGPDSLQSDIIHTHRLSYAGARRALSH